MRKLFLSFMAFASFLVAAEEYGLMQSLLDRQTSLAVAINMYIEDRGSVPQSITVLKNANYLPLVYDEKNPFDKDALTFSVANNQIRIDSNVESASRKADQVLYYINSINNRDLDRRSAQEGGKLISYYALSAKAATNLNLSSYLSYATLRGNIEPNLYQSVTAGAFWFSSTYVEDMYQVKLYNGSSWGGLEKSNKNFDSINGTFVNLTMLPILKSSWQTTKVNVSQLTKPILCLNGGTYNVYKFRCEAYTSSACTTPGTSFNTTTKLCDKGANSACTWADPNAKFDGTNCGVATTTTTQLSGQTWTQNIAIDDGIIINMFWDSVQGKFFWIQSTNNWPTPNNMFDGYSRATNGLLYAYAGEYHTSGYLALQNGLGYTTDGGFDADGYYNTTYVPVGGSPSSFIDTNKYGVRTLNEFQAPNNITSLAIRFSVIDYDYDTGEPYDSQINYMAISNTQKDQTISWYAGGTSGAYLQYPTINMQITATQVTQTYYTQKCAPGLTPVGGRCAETPTCSGKSMPVTPFYSTPYNGGNGVCYSDAALTCAQTGNSWDGIYTCFNTSFTCNDTAYNLRTDLGICEKFGYSCSTGKRYGLPESPTNSDNTDLYNRITSKDDKLNVIVSTITKSDYNTSDNNGAMCATVQFTTLSQPTISPDYTIGAEIKSGF